MFERIVWQYWENSPRYPDGIPYIELCHQSVDNNVKINSVLRCRNNECGIVIVRDINGCKNIFKIFKCALEGKDRPKILPKKKTRPTVKVGIIAK